MLLLLLAGYGFASQGPRSFQAQFQALTAPSSSTRRAVDQSAGTMPGLAHRVLTEADLNELPDLVAAYVRQSGVVGQAPVASFRAQFHGRIRSGPTCAWMTFTGEQRNTFGDYPSKVFAMDASIKHVPVDVLHAFVNGRATMRVKVCSMVPIGNASGQRLDRAETVTVFNDLCVLAPAALVHAPISWMALDDARVRGAFTTGDHTVVADLTFNPAHELVDFVSDHRATMSSDHDTLIPRRWSTPYPPTGPTVPTPCLLMAWRDGMTLTGRTATWSSNSTTSPTPQTLRPRNRTEPPAAVSHQGFDHAWERSVTSSPQGK